MAQPVAKDVVTESVRRLVLTSAGAVETIRADVRLTTLSFQSTSLPDRHTWIDTDLAGEMVVDLEEWSTVENWDNAVAPGYGTARGRRYRVAGGAVARGVPGDRCNRSGPAVTDSG